ncbi:MAG: hypothetical protein MUO52_06295 [Desulfobacterales bacterium]|nr:hypothetical protein [Desulfobacterales bacterium]
MNTPSFIGGFMADLTIHNYEGLSEEELSQALLDEKRKMFGSEGLEDSFREGPVTLYSDPHRKPEE